MPFHKRQRRPRRGKHRRGKKAPRKIQNANIVPFNSSPLARRHIVRMKYNDQVNFTTLTAGSEASQTFRMNSTFDPDKTSTGHQPYGRDTLAGLYEHYRVYKFGYIITAPSTNDRYNVCVLPFNGSVPPSTWQEAAEMPMAKSKSLSYQGCNPAVFKGSVYLPKLAGVPRVRYMSEVDYASTVATNPNEVMDLIIFVDNVSGATINISVNVTLFYYTEWYDPFALGQS